MKDLSDVLLIDPLTIYNIVMLAVYLDIGIVQQIVLPHSMDPELSIKAVLRRF